MAIRRAGGMAASLMSITFKAASLVEYKILISMCIYKNSIVRTSLKSSKKLLILIGSRRTGFICPPDVLLTIFRYSLGNGFSYLQ
ncbi:hypothetical protein [uncultured Sneathiella sp.]|uniref:hypothetical protein n=1 Tax=uncultured Sneathiella sp. TaxID=879315 RepID=UPI0030ECF93A